MRVLICDDERPARERLMRLLGELPDVEVIGEAENGLECLQKSHQLQPSVVLLDMRMPLMDGLATAEQLARQATPPAVVFCTAYDEHALAAFDVQAAGYLLKPVTKERLREALQRAQVIHHAQQQHSEGQTPAASRRTHISARTHRGVELIALEDIRYFMADQKYVTVRHSQGEILIDETLKDLENEFTGSFIRIHRNALLSLRYLDGLELVSPGQYQVRIRGIDDRLAVSRRHLAELRETMQKL